MYWLYIYIYIYIYIYVCVCVCVCVCVYIYIYIPMYTNVSCPSKTDMFDRLYFLVCIERVLLRVTVWYDDSHTGAGIMRMIKFGIFIFFLIHLLSFCFLLFSFYLVSMGFIRPRFWWSPRIHALSNFLSRTPKRLLHMYWRRFCYYPRTTALP